MWFAIAAAWGLAEATLFFVVPDVLLTWLAGFRRGSSGGPWRRAWVGHCSAAW